MFPGLIHKEQKRKEKKQLYLIVLLQILILLLVLFASPFTHNIISFICIGSLGGKEALDLFEANLKNFF